MNRRAFFRTLAAAAIAAPAAAEELLWRPGAKLISIPKVLRVPMTVENIRELTLEYINARYVVPAAREFAFQIENSVRFYRNGTLLKPGDRISPGDHLSWSVTGKHGNAGCAFLGGETGELGEVVN